MYLVSSQFRVRYCMTCSKRANHLEHVAQALRHLVNPGDASDWILRRMNVGTEKRVPSSAGT
jgi:hypothetical protein